MSELNRLNNPFFQAWYSNLAAASQDGNNSTISQTDLTAQIYQCNQKGEPDQLDQLLSDHYAAFDTNGDGKLDANEVCNAYQAYLPQFTQPQQSFRLTKEKFDKWYSKLGGEDQAGNPRPLSAEDLDRRIKRGQEKGLKTPLAQYLKTNFDAIDTDHDGALGQNEILAARLKTGEPLIQITDAA